MNDLIQHTLLVLDSACSISSAYWGYRIQNYNSKLVWLLRLSWQIFCLQRLQLFFKTILISWNKDSSQQNFVEHHKQQIAQSPPTCNLQFMVIWCCWSYDVTILKVSNCLKAKVQFWDIHKMKWNVLPFWVIIYIILKTKNCCWRPTFWQPQSWYSFVD